MTGWTVGVGGEKVGGEVSVMVKASLMRGARGRRLGGWWGVVVGELRSLYSMYMQSNGCS